MLPRVFGSRMEEVPGGLSARTVVRARWSKSSRTLRAPSRPEWVAPDWPEPGDDRAVTIRPRKIRANRIAATPKPVTSHPATSRAHTRGTTATSSATPSPDTRSTATADPCTGPPPRSPDDGPHSRPGSGRGVPECASAATSLGHHRAGAPSCSYPPRSCCTPGTNPGRRRLGVGGIDDRGRRYPRHARGGRDGDVL